jgi:hypothetical protein
MSLTIQNKGFQTIFKMAWKYLRIKKIQLYEILYLVLLDMVFMNFLYIFSKILYSKMFMRCPHSYFLEKMIILPQA